MVIKSIARNVVPKLHRDEKLVGMQGKELKHNGLYAGQYQQVYAAVGLTSEPVQGKIGHGGLVGIAGALERACAGSNAGQQFLVGERFDEIIIGAAVQAGNPLVYLVQGREHEDGCGDAALTHRARHLTTVHFGEQNIEQNQIVFVGLCKIQSGFPIGHRIDDKAFFGQPLFDKSGDVAFVLDQKNPHAQNPISLDVSRWQTHRVHPAKRLFAQACALPSHRRQVEPLYLIRVCSK